MTLPPAVTDSASSYWCFISYRHADNSDEDRKWATWLQQEIERYEVPGDLVGSGNERAEIIPQTIYPVFRDEESLPADSNLGEKIISALDRSRYLVVTCSPRAVESRYVREEIEHFQQTGRGDRIIPAIIAGEPGDPSHPERECFPEPLRYRASQDGAVDLNAGPLAADFRLDDQERSEGYTSAEAY